MNNLSSYQARLFTLLFNCIYIGRARMSSDIFRLNKPAGYRTSSNFHRQPPFTLSGNLSVADLKELHKKTLLRPTDRKLGILFPKFPFDCSRKVVRLPAS